MVVQQVLQVSLNSNSQARLPSTFVVQTWYWQVRRANAKSTLLVTVVPSTTEGLSASGIERIHSKARQEATGRAVYSSRKLAKGANCSIHPPVSLGVSVPVAACVAQG